jgi:predicted RNA-binding Zn ribbon-like protein
MGTKAGGAALVVDALNSVDVDGGTDAWANDLDYLAWCTSRDLEPGSRRDAMALRDGLRAALSGRAPAHVAALPLLPVVQDTDGGLRLNPVDLPGAIAASVVTLTIAGDWPRVKVCPADDCLEAFYDGSRNRSRVWCAMADCGNRAKTRKYRSRIHDSTGE